MSEPTGAVGPDPAVGAVAYADAEWLRASASLVVAADGTVRFADAWEAQAPAGLDPHVVSGHVLEAIAAAAVTAARGHAPPGPIHVTGRGVLAARIEQLLPARGEGRPAAIIDTTGDPSVVVQCTLDLVDLGVLVLAGVPADAPLAINLYPDVHVRGLRVIGGGPLGRQARAAVMSAPGQALPSLLAHEPPELDECVATSPRSGWYRLAAART